MPPIINKEQCSACGVCVEICPCDVLHMAAGEEIPQITYPEECWHCNACVLDCASEAMRLRVPLPAMMLYLDARERN